ncbi:Putative centrosomin motif 1, Mto2p-binding domain-containing protein [Septoria linicola]|uniref:Centrosomin motif 1, Mto2p-binding domain-containing protein n=1 Tax=Septoria linicola TaxID=215465 RepID=A0A9Q9EQP9_9PEZI|nr:putative centrosomin motif 1, Mto2p-binding domain-containing protein [Septoria linicola]USW59042.1 Putative centrosomin motif 1, Mto2p-binding domain-containing protein [Septoria linicola]
MATEEESSALLSPPPVLESSFHDSPSPSPLAHHGNKSASASIFQNASNGEDASERRSFLSANSLLDRLPSFSTVGSSSSLNTMTPSEMAAAADPVTPRRLSSEQQAYRAYEADLDNALDTAITRRVQSIQVPETVARDFRLKTRSVSPDRRPASSGGYGEAYLNARPRRTLTLKEQNAKMDVLTKENFDLKLKIHFLDQALQNRSEDGIKELVETNVQLQTDLANERKENANMRKRMRDMEMRLKQQEEALAEAQAQQKNTARDEEDDNPTLQAQMHEEILYLHQQNDRLEEQVTTLREEVMDKELEKRKMAEHMRGMAGKRGQDANGMKEMEDMWQDLLNAETGRREQAEDELSTLRNELTKLQMEKASPAPNRVADRNLKTPRRRSRLLSVDDGSSDAEEDIANGVRSVQGDLIDQLKHENDELRRNLGAQTSMLTSRNRERERLQEEIESLKLLQRKGDGRSLAGESIFDRSISRAHQRSQSRASDHTAVTEAERDEWHKKEGQLRDSNAEQRLKYQELDRKYQQYMNYIQVLESDYQQMETELDQQQEDLKTLQQERDELIAFGEDKENEIANLKEEAVEEITALDQQRQKLDQRLEEAYNKLDKTQSKLQTTTDGYQGLQAELCDITSRVIDLEDVKAHNMRTIETLEQQIAEAEEEITKWEQKCNELDQKNRKLEIAEESLHSEITFLRDEQEGDKIKIGELESSLNAAQATIQDEQEKLRELGESIEEERRQRDTLENKSKEEVQKVLDDLNNENTRSKDEVRRLRRALSTKEVEASSEKQKLDQLEQNLRNILGDPDGTRQSLLGDIEKLQRELETTISDLDRAKMDISDKDRLLRHRDGLLESTSLESRRLSDLLEKERNQRKHDLESFEKASRGQATHMRTIAQQESKVLELETLYGQDKRKMAQLEQQYREQLHERNNLLLALWNRLSTLCGADWAQNHSLVNGEVPSVEAIQRHLPSFNKNVISAVKTIEALIGSFKQRIRTIEKDLWRDYQTLEHNLDLRARRMDSLERAVIEAQQQFEEQQRIAAQEAASRPELPARGKSFTMKSSEEVGKLKSEVKILKAELKFHRQHPSAMAQQLMNAQNQALSGEPIHSRTGSSAGSISGSGKSPARQALSSLLRHQSTSAVEQLNFMQRHSEENVAPSPVQQIVVPQQQPAHNETRWVHRLKELERRLKAEREARLMDRQGARKRLEEGRLENEELKAMLERERLRHEDGTSVVGSEITGHGESR